VATPQEAPEDEAVISRLVLGAEACSPEGTDPVYACHPDCSGTSRKAGKAVSEMSGCMAVSFSETLESELLDGACGVCDETTYPASGLCIRCRGGSASRAWKSDGAMMMGTPKWSWHVVASPPLEMHRRMERRIAGGIVNGSEAAWSKDDDSGRILLAECPALRRHQNLVKNLAMMILNMFGAEGCTTFCSTWRMRCVRRNVWTEALVRSALVAWKVVSNTLLCMINKRDVVASCMKRFLPGKRIYECVHVLFLITRDVLFVLFQKHMLLTFQEGYSSVPEGCTIFCST
jgi:hypothetical protein